MFYDYLITTYKVLVGLVTPERMMTIAILAFIGYIVWICASLFLCFQRKFNSNCQSLISFIMKNNSIENNLAMLDEPTSKISRGFGFGWKKFRKSEFGKPSDYITRRDTLDVEVNGGVLNQGKTFMRAYIALVTLVLFIFNFAYIGGENPITFITFAETLIFPTVFYVVLKLFYFLHNSIKQKFFRMDIESFYEVIDLLDSKFSKEEKVVIQEVVKNETMPEVAEDLEETKVENQELGQVESESEVEETIDLQEIEEPEQEEDQNNILDKYDVFKKKNIDVSKIMNETPSSSSALPYINVDSDYVLKDDDEVGAKIVNKDDNASTILGGMLQNTSKKNGNAIDVDKEIAQIDENKISKLDNKETENSETSLSDEEKELIDDISEVLNELAEEQTEVTSSQESEEVETTEEKEPETAENAIEETPVEDTETKEPEEDAKEESKESTDVKEEKVEEPKENEPEEQNVDERENIANLVSGFKASRSRLATGGVIIERNQPILKRDRNNLAQEQNQFDAYNNDVSKIAPNQNEDVVLDSLKGNQSGFGAGQGYMQQNYSQPVYDGYGYNPNMFAGQGNPQMQGYEYGVENPNYAGYQQGVYPNYNQAPYQNVGVPEEQGVEQVDETQEKQPKKKKVVRTKENEPRPRSFKSKEKNQEDQGDDAMAKRGRPKKEEFTEDMVIENETQFNVVLSRAEKLMRKSEEGLSESQSKRIEKELKVLMDAMNRYKESK